MKKLLIFSGLISTLFLVHSTLAFSEQNSRASIFLPLILKKPNLSGPLTSGWYMAGANPQRSSWISEEVSSDVSVNWYRNIEPYIPEYIQLITANNLIYVSTANGLLAIHADTGQLAWRFDTSMPIGHSPTVIEDRLFVAGYDKQVHCLNALTGEKIWSFSGSLAGYSSNPLVINGKVFIGSRSGYFYAIDALNGQKLWQYPLEDQDPLGPIAFSPAYHSGTIYFASNDNYAYALTETGQLKWKSPEKLRGERFQAFWPVIYQDKVVFTADHSYRYGTPGTKSVSDKVQHGNYGEIEKEVTDYDVQELGPRSISSEADEYPNGVELMDASQIFDYFEAKPWRSTVTILNQADGAEYTVDTDGDGQQERSPFLFHGTKNGLGYPPIVRDKILFQNNWYKVSSGISRAQVTGWILGSEKIFLTEAGIGAVDEPQAISGGGDWIYRNICCYRVGDGKNLLDGQRNKYWDYQGSSWIDLEDRAPGFDDMWKWMEKELPGYDGFYRGSSDSLNGYYHSHGLQNPIIPYKGALYVHRSNSVISLAPEGNKQRLSLVVSKESNATNTPFPLLTSLRRLLDHEVNKIIVAGHLRPGYRKEGWSGRYGSLVNYFEDPGDTFVVLAMAYPYVSNQSQLKTYLEAEYNQYFRDSTIRKLGWNKGAAREAALLPPEVENDLKNYDSETGSQLTPYTIYGLWKYAELVAPEKSQEIYQLAKSKLDTSPDVDEDKPWTYHQYLAGYYGFLQLYDMVEANDTDLKNQIKQTYDRLLAERTNKFSKNSPWTEDKHLRAFNGSRNFLWLTPEVGKELGEKIKSDVEEAVEEYEYLAPYWFAANFEASSNERSIQNLYDTSGLFKAKAYILESPKEHLYLYLDSPGFYRGDMLYIENLIVVIKAAE